MLQLIDGHIHELMHLKCKSGEGARRPEGAAQYVLDIYVPQEEGVEPKPLIDQLDEVEGRINGLLLDTAKLTTAVVLSTVKYHDPSFDLQNVSEDVDLTSLVRREDVMAAA
jgi:hypothetical protein